MVKNPSANAEDVSSDPGLRRVQSLEEEMATHSNTLAWEIPWTEEPGGLQPIVSQTVKHVTGQQINPSQHPFCTGNQVGGPIKSQAGKGMWWAGPSVFEAVLDALCFPLPLGPVIAASQTS